MNLGELHSQIRSTIKRGTAMDAEITLGVRAAAKWLERNYAFKYMERLVTFTLDPERAQPRAYALPEPGMRSIKFMRYLSDTNEYHYILQMSPEELLSVGQGLPERYWIDAAQSFWFDKTPDQAYTIELSYCRYSDWPTDLAETNWLLTFAEDVLLSQTMLLLAPTLRLSAELVGLHKGLRDEGLRTLILSTDEFQQSSREYRMG